MRIVGGIKIKSKLLLLVVSLVLLVVTTALVIAGNIPKSSSDRPVINFKTSTVAICEYNEDSVYCHDELLVNCGDEEYILPKDEETVNCDGIALQVPPITAFAVFDEDWQDPRYLAE